VRTEASMVKALYEEHAGELLHYLARRCPDPATARDLLQETFFQVVRQSKQLGRITLPRAWLFGIARRILARHYRDRDNRARLQECAVVPEAVAPDERLPVLRETIRRLPKELRETLELRLDQEFSYEEIARVLEIPIGTVRSRLHNAVRSLREQMKKSL